MQADLLTMSCKQQCPTVVLAILIIIYSNNISNIVQAFQNVRNVNNNFVLSGGCATHQQQHEWLVRTSSSSAVAAKSSDGYDDWYIDEEENVESEKNIDKVSTTKNGASSTYNDDDNDIRIRTYFATCIPGLHETLSHELTSLGGTNIEPQGKSGVKFQGTSIVGMKCILWCRTAHKVMELIASSSSSSDHPTPSFQLDDYDDGDYDNEYDYNQNYYTENGIRNKDDLYHFIKSAIHTPTLLGNGSGGLLTLSVSTIYASKPPNKDLCHGHFTALTVKNALVDDVRELRDDGERPNVDVEDSDVPLVVVIKGRHVNENGTGWRRGRRGRGGYNNDYDEREEDDDNMVADVDLYRVLHSGGSLHRRGYRQGNDSTEEYEEEAGGNEWESSNSHSSSNSAPIHRAAMKETLAAGLLLEAGWDKLVMAARGDGQGAVLVDPMCGSATFPVEASLIACDMAPGLLRIASWRGGGKNGSSSSSSQNRNPHRCPPCVRWKDFGTSQDWDELLTSATQRAKSGMKWARSVQPECGLKNVKILCNELNPRAASLARSSIRSAGVGAIVSLNQGDCVDWDLGGDNEDNGTASNEPRDIIEGRTIFVCNPPWGLRLTEDIDESWVSLREFLRREAGGCESWVLSGNKDLTKILRMKKSRTVVVKTADEDLRWLQYHIFQKNKVST